MNELPAFWNEITQSDAFEKITSSTGTDDKVADALKDLAAGLPDAANTLIGAAGGVFSSILSLVTLTFLALFLLMERPTITDWLFGFAPPEIEARWRPVLEESIRAVSSSLSETWRSRSSRAPWPGSRRGRSGCRSRSCSR